MKLHDITYMVVPIYTYGCYETAAVHFTATIPALRALYACIKSSMYSNIHSSRHSDLLHRSSAARSGHTNQSPTKSGDKHFGQRQGDDKMFEKAKSKTSVDSESQEEMEILAHSGSTTISNRKGSTMERTSSMSSSSSSFTLSLPANESCPLPSQPTFSIESKNSHHQHQQQQQQQQQPRTVASHSSSLPPSPPSPTINKSDSISKPGNTTKSRSLLKSFKSRYSTIEEVGPEFEDEAFTLTQHTSSASSQPSQAPATTTDSSTKNNRKSLSLLIRRSFQQGREPKSALSHHLPQNQNHYQKSQPPAISRTPPSPPVDPHPGLEVQISSYSTPVPPIPIIIRHASTPTTSPPPSGSASIYPGLASATAPFPERGSDLEAENDEAEVWPRSAV